jgi:hypothetical protein
VPPPFFAARTGIAENDQLGMATPSPDSLDPLSLSELIGVVRDLIYGRKMRSSATL